MKHRIDLRGKKTLFPVLLSLLLLAVLAFLPTGYEGALSYQNADRVDALVLSTDESDIINTGLVRSGEQRCQVRLLSGQFAGIETTAVNRLNGSLAEDKLFSPGDKAFVVVSHAEGEITTVYMTDHYRLGKEAISKPLGHQRDDSHKGAVAETELLLSTPDLAKEHIIVQFRKFRGKFAQGISARRLFDCHVPFLRYSFAYSSSDTGSHHAFLQCSPGTSTAIWLNQLSFFAPCQCLTLAEIITTLPSCRLTAALPSS